MWFLRTYRIASSPLSRGILSIAICLSILALFASALRLILADYSFHNRGVGWGESQAEAFISDDYVIGINAALENEDEENLYRSISLIRGGGYRWVRQAFPWREIEQVKGTYDWQKWDRLVSAYTNAGLNVVARLDQPPHWSRNDNNWVNRPPDAFKDYADFVAAFVAHYRGKIDYVQIWDEPNIFPNWGNRPVDPAEYVELLKAAYAAAKAANPDVKVLTAGLAPNSEQGGRNMADTLFLEAMYSHGAKDYFDILAAKPYGLWNPPDDRRIDDSVANFSRVVRLRETMVAHGDDDKPVWAVEFGWNSLPQDWKGEPTVWGRVTEEEQAIYTRKAIERARKEWPWLRVMLVQGFGPRYAPSNPLYGFSVVDDAFRPRPVYFTLQEAAAYPYAPVGRHLANSRYIHYRGAWQTSGNGKLGNKGDSLTLPFEGTRIDAIVWRSAAGGAIEVTVDGERTNLSPQLGAYGRADLTSPEPRRARLTLASGLKDGEHVLDLSVVEGRAGAEGGEVVIEGFSVIRDAPFSFGQISFAVGLASQVGALLWLIVALPALYRTEWPAIRPWLSSIARRIARFEQVVGEVRGEWVLVGMSLCLGIFYFVSLVPVAIAGLLAYALLTLARPDFGLLYVVFAAPFYLLPKRFGALQFSMAEILILTCLAVVVTRRAVDALAGSQPSSETNGAGISSLFGPVRIAGFTPPILLFVAASLFSLLAAERLHEGLRELRTVILEPVILYWLLTNVLNKKDVSLLADALIASAVLLAIVSLYQYVFTADVITAEGVRRAKAFFGSPNNLGLFLGRALPLAVCLGWLSGTSLRSRVLYLAAAFFIAVAIVLTFSAGSWLGTAGALLVVLAFRSVRLWGVAMAGTIGLALALPQVFRLERITSRFDFEQGTAALRLWIWQAAAKMIQAHPLLGVGLDNFLNQYPRYMLPAAWREPNLSHPHNLVLDYWLRTGLLGLVASLWLIARFFATAVRLHRRSADVKMRALALGLLGSMTDFAMHGMIDNAYFAIDLAIIFWTSLAAVNIMERE